MARYLPLLDDAQRRALDRPPKWTATQRKRYCSLPDWATQVLGSLVTPHSRSSFVLQVGCFQATGRFFSTDRFRAADGAFVQQRYRLGAVEWARYDKATRFHHRQLILQQFGVAPFEQVEATVRAQVTHFARQQMNPMAAFRTAVDTMRSRRWELPTYAILAGVVTDAFYQKYLMVLCCVVYQYYQVGDLLTETLLQAVQTHRNAAQREAQERVYASSRTRPRNCGNCSIGW